jgi:hypothetical protein
MMADRRDAVSDASQQEIGHSSTEIARAEAAETAQAWVRAVDLVDRIVADLRAEADKWDKKSMVPGTADDLRRRYMKLHEELRRLANKYEKLADKMDDDGR